MRAVTSPCRPAPWARHLPLRRVASEGTRGGSALCHLRANYAVPQCDSISDNAVALSQLPKSHMSYTHRALCLRLQVATVGLPGLDSRRIRQ